MFEPLRIRAFLQTGVVSDQYLPLDAVLYYHAVRQKFGPQDVTIPGHGVVIENKQILLPILNNYQEKGSEWFYACSFAQWPTHTVESVQHYTKRFDQSQSDLIDFKGKVGRVITERGQYKSLFNKLYYQHALYVDWYCVGNKTEIEDLLRYCTHLGKKPSQGFGRVIRWEVKEWPEDWSTYGPNGKIMRAIPNEKGSILYGIRPSYWLPKHQFLCHMPE